MKYLPSRKWFAATAILLGGFATVLIQTGWDEASQISLVAIITSRVVSYLLPDAAPQP